MPFGYVFGWSVKPEVAARRVKKGLPGRTVASHHHCRPLGVPCPTRLPRLVWSAPHQACSPPNICESTWIVPLEMVDAVLERCGPHQRLRSIPSRVVVYLLLVAGLFTALG
jgi:hypothetical protein